MTLPRRLCILAIAIALPALPVTSSAQSDWELNGHGAVLVNDLFRDGGSGLLTGVRLFHHTASGLAIGGSLGWAQAGSTTLGTGLDAVDTDASLVLYTAEVAFAAPRRSRTQALFGAGIGGVSTSFDGGTPGFTESTTGTLVPITFGLLFNNDAERPTWAFRLEVRDNLISVDTRPTAGGPVEEELRSNWEISAGFSYRFGRSGDEAPAVEPPDTPPPAPADRPLAEAPDTDRDGVPDADDRCVNTPRGAAVNERGCPVEEPPAAPVDAAPADEAAAGAEEPDAGPEAPPACLGPQPWFEAGESIEALDRTWAKAGPTEPITLENLVLVGVYESIPVYVGRFQDEPYPWVWLPVCENGEYQAYETTTE